MQKELLAVGVAQAMRIRVTDISIRYLGVASSAKIARDAKARMVLVKFAAERAISDRRGPTLGKNAEEREREMALELTMHGDYREALAKSESATALHEEHRAMLDCLLAEQDADRWMIQAIQIDMMQPPRMSIPGLTTVADYCARLQTPDPHEVPFETGRKDGEV